TEKEDLGVIEEIAEFFLGIANRPVVQDAPQASPRGDGDRGYQIFQALGTFLDKAMGTHIVVVTYHSQTNRISSRLPLLDQGLRLGFILIGADPDDPELLPEKLRLEVVVQAFWPQADANNRFHYVLRISVLIHLASFPGVGDRSPDHDVILRRAYSFSKSSLTNK